MRAFGHTRLDLDDRLAVDAALDEAFAPLRGTTANISAARVRAAVRWSHPEPRPLGRVALLSRVAELSVAAAISALVFGATLTSVSEPTSTDRRDPLAAGGRELNGRLALQRPMDSRFTDYRATAGDLAANAATVRREAASIDALRAPGSINH